MNAPRAITIRLAEPRDAQAIALMSRDFIEAGLGWKYDDVIGGVVNSAIRRWNA